MKFKKITLEFLKYSSLLIITGIFLFGILTILFSKNQKEINNQIYREITQLKEYKNLQEQLMRNFDFLSIVNENISIKDAKQIIESMSRYMNYTHLSNKELFFSICAKESNFIKEAKNEISEDYGLCQINKHTYYSYLRKGIIKKDEWERIFEIDYNIYIASLILNENYKYIKNKFKNETNDFYDRALITSYNNWSFGKRGKSTNYTKSVISISKKVLIFQ